MSIKKTHSPLRNEDHMDFTVSLLQLKKMMEDLAFNLSAPKDLLTLPFPRSMIFGFVSRLF